MTFSTMKLTSASFTTTSSEVELKFLEVSDASGNSPDGARRYADKLRIHTDNDVYLEFSKGGGQTAVANEETARFFPAGIVEVIDLPEGVTHVAGITAAATANVKFETGYGE